MAEVGSAVAVEEGMELFLMWEASPLLLLSELRRVQEPEGETGEEGEVKEGGGEGETREGGVKRPRNRFMASCLAVSWKEFW